MGLLVFIIAFILIFIFFIVFRNNKKMEPDSISELITSEEEYNSALTDTDDFDKEYFERIEKGEASQQFLVIGGQQDCGLIRSLLAADGIPTYTENENINSMYGGTSVSVTGVFAIKLFILVNDYDKAYEIVCGYANSKKENPEAETTVGKTFARTAGAVVTGLFFAPFPVNAEQKGMGITILPKENINAEG